MVTRTLDPSSVDLRGVYHNMQLASVIMVMVMVIWTTSLPIDIQPELSLQRFEQTEGFEFALSNLRVRKFNRTCAVLNGTIDILVPLDNSHTFQLGFAHSRLGNNQFNMYPMKLPVQKFCDFANDTWRHYQSMFENTTNLMQIGEEGVCPVPPGRYWFKDWVPIIDVIPPVVPEGFWRGTVILNGSQGTALFDLYMKLSRKSFW